MHSEYSRHQRNRRPESWTSTLGGILAGCIALALFVFSVLSMFGAAQ